MALITSSARAEGARVVVVDAEPRVTEAIDVALSPWSLVVLRAPGPLPEADIVTALARARAIAGEDRAGAVVWIEPASANSVHPSLWVYDAETQQLAVRPLGASAPFDEAGAAAVALSVKTILRGSALDASARPPPPAQAPAPPENAPPVRVRAEPAPQVEREPGWRIEADAAVQTPTAARASDAFQIRAGLGASVWPRAVGGHVGAGVSVHGGPSVALDLPFFHGQLFEGSLEATGRLGARAAPWLAFELQTGPALVLVDLDGETRPSPKPAHALRLNPAWGASAVVDFRLSSRISVGALAGMSAALFRVQSFTVDNVLEVTREPNVVARFGVRLSVGVD